MERYKLLIGSIISSVVCIGLVSCASIVSGTKAEIVLNGSVDEPVNIQTDYMMYERQFLPVTVKVKRGKKDSKIEISSENYMFEDILVEKTGNGWIAANYLHGGIGIFVDVIDGAAWKPKEKSYDVVATKKKLTSAQEPEIESRSENNISGDRLDNVADGTTQHIPDTEQKSGSNSFKLFLDNYIAEWEKKGEFETTAQWKQRISEENKQEVLPELSSKAKQLYIVKESEKVESSVRLGRYDADNELFEILTDVKTIYADVPLTVAPLFKGNWDKVEKQFEYDIVDGNLFIKSALFKYDGKEYHTVKVIKEESIQSVFSNANDSEDVADSIVSQSDDVKGKPLEQSSSDYATLPKNIERAYNVSNSKNKSQIQLKKDCVYYLRCENPDNLKYVEKYFKKYLQSNKIKTTDDMEQADAIITGHAIDIEGGLLFYMTVMDVDGTLLWLSEIEEAKKYKFERSVKSVMKHSCRDLAKVFKTKVSLPISSPLHPMYKRISDSEFTTPEYSVALKLYQDEEYKAAIKSLNKVIEAHPYFANAYFLRSIAQCRVRDINDGKRDMMYFHILSPFDDERFDVGCKYVYYEIARRSERRMRNVQIFAGVANATAQGISNVSRVANGYNPSIGTVPTFNNTSITQTNSTNSQKRVCDICHGTGKNPSPSTVAQYGQVTYQYCDICKKTGTPHYHKVCFKCLGKKYVNY